MKSKRQITVLIFAGLILAICSCSKERFAYDINLVLGESNGLSNLEVAELVEVLGSPPDIGGDTAFYFQYHFRVIAPTGDTVLTHRLPNIQNLADISMFDPSLREEIRENMQVLISSIKTGVNLPDGKKLDEHELLHGFRINKDSLYLYSVNSSPDGNWSFNDRDFSVFDNLQTLQKAVLDGLHTGLPSHVDKESKHHQVYIYVRQFAQLQQPVNTAKQIQVGDTISNQFPHGVVIRRDSERNRQGHANDVFDVSPIPNTYYLGIGHYRGGNGFSAYSNAKAHAKKERWSENSYAMLLKDGESYNVIIRSAKKEAHILEEYCDYLERYQKTMGGLRILYSGPDNVLREVRPSRPCISK